MYKRQHQSWGRKEGHTVTTATVHRLAGPASPVRGGLNMPDAETKLDRLLEAVSDIKAGQAAMTAHMDGFRSTTDRIERELGSMRDRHDRDVADVARRAETVESAAIAMTATPAELEKIHTEIDALKARPEGITWKQFLAGSASVAGLMWAGIQILGVMVKALNG